MQQCPICKDGWLKVVGKFSDKQVQECSSCGIVLISKIPLPKERNGILCQCGRKLWEIRTATRNYCPYCGKKVLWPEDQEIMNLEESELRVLEK
jgi:hypothetical protein